MQIGFVRPLSALSFWHCVTRRVSLRFERMADEIPKTAAAAPAPSNSVAQQLFPNPVKLLQAVADPVRWAVMRELAAGRPVTVNELAARLKHAPDSVSHHLRWLREAGAVVVLNAPGQDARKKLYAPPPGTLRDGPSGKKEIDYGALVLRFG